MVSKEVAAFRAFLFTAMAGMLLSLGCVATHPESESGTSAESDSAAQSEPEARSESQAPQTEGTARPASSETKTEAAAGTKRTAEAPSPPPKPSFTDFVVPTGTVLELELVTPLDSAANRVGDEVRARTSSAVSVDGRQVLAAGSEVLGRVTEVKASGKVKGRASLAFAFDRLMTPSGVVDMKTSFVSLEAESGKKKDAATIGGAAGVGAIVGGIIGGKKGAAIGAGIGGAGGTAVVLNTKGKEIRVEKGSALSVRLDAPVTIRVQES